MTAALVLLHGLGGSPAVWRRLTPLLSHEGRVVTPRLVNPARIEADADALAAELGDIGPAILVGHSRGGLVATALAERHPHLVGHVVVVNSPPTAAARRRSHGERALGLPVLGRLAWSAMPRSSAARGLATAFAPGQAVPELFVDDLRRTGHSRFLAASRAIDTYLDAQSLPERLGSLVLPVDVINGQLDLRLDLSPYDALSAARLTTIPSAGHTPPWETPDLVASVIRAAVRTKGRR